MRKPEHAKHMKKRPRLLLYLLLAVVATMLATTGTMAKYSSQFSASASAQVAAFAGGGTLDFDLDLEDIAPGDTRTVQFTVQNYDGERNCEVALDYEIAIDTMGNLPLTFTLLGKKETGDSEKGSQLAGPLDKELTASGGKLPVAVGESSRKQHTYELSISWPKEETNEDYSQEIDFVTVTVTTKQAELEPAGEQSSSAEVTSSQASSLPSE